MDALSAMVAGRHEAFKSHRGKADVAVSIVIEYYGTDPSFGWVLSPRHIQLIADLGASLDVDEHDYTES